MPDVVTSATPYAGPADLLAYADWRVVADWSAAGPGPRPTRAALLDPTHPAGENVATALLAASGDVESYCLRGGVYDPADLAALTGAGREFLRRIVSGLALWTLAARRNPGAADPKSVPGVQEARDALTALRVGERIFGLAAVRDAGAGMDAVPIVSADPRDERRTVNAASRYFGNRTPRG